ncbi:response regulator [Paraburkholderia solisilvae]|uniref:Phosphate regulon transcriptional regulatory protein PhoB n=1 Tax=Paraburkholderia solisilvae TaxID=624376 RepID=A0A6J5E9Q2_9BURK|nr:response regulator [Paraburkholderia solisilvae]CAB3762051.1 Phosphate regulon transcriptional regulatory protein PhoB [Paraburkholderia solisilvae]
MSTLTVRSHARHDLALGAEAEILIVDADLRVCETLWSSMQAAGYRPCVASTAQHAAELIAMRVPHALVLDWMLPDRSGLSFLTDLRDAPRTWHLPAIMLSARDNDDDCVRALDAGADDFVRKPFSPPELISRLRGLLRPKPRHHPPAPISVQGLTLDLAARRVTSGAGHAETALRLSAFECQLLRFFLTNTHRVYSRKEIMREICGPHASYDDRNVDLHVFYLRKALRALGHDAVIETVRGRGYRLTDRIDPQAGAMQVPDASMQ